VGSGRGTLVTLEIARPWGKVSAHDAISKVRIGAHYVPETT